MVPIDDEYSYHSKEYDDDWLMMMMIVAMTTSMPTHNCGREMMTKAK
jgi:hypothetical protein